MKLFLILALVFRFGQSFELPENNCPNYLTHQPSGNGYEGMVYVPNDFSGNYEFEANGSLPFSSNLRMSMNIANIEQIKQGPVSHIICRIKFPSDQTFPRITVFLANGRRICSDEPYKLTHRGTTSLWAKTTLQASIQTRPKKPTTVNFPATIPIDNGTEFFVVKPSSPEATPPTLFTSKPIYSVRPPTYSTNTTFYPVQPPVYGTKPTTFEEPVYGRRPSTLPTIPSPSLPPRQQPTLPEVTTTSRPLVPFDSQQCGRVVSASSLVVLGKEVNEGECPWMVAVYFYNYHNKKYKFRCTANLISNKHVITVGHCVQFENVLIYDKDDLVLVLGLSNLENWARRGTKAKVSDIRVHPSYVQNQGGYDLAIITMAEPVALNNFIYPICLWHSGESLDGIKSGGSVAGWGQTNFGAAHSEQANKVDTPVVSHEECLRSHEAFTKIATPHTFCGGSRNGAGPCGGDSGAGFFINHNGRYHLRGLVAYVRATDDSRCDLNNYVVFADIAADTEWIKNIMKVSK